MVYLPLWWITPTEGCLNNVATDIDTQGSLGIPAFNAPTGGTAGSYGNSGSLLKEPSNCSPQRLLHFMSPPASKGSGFSTSSPKSVISPLVDEDSYPDRCEVLLHCASASPFSEDQRLSIFSRVCWSFDGVLRNNVCSGS